MSYSYTLTIGANTFSSSDMEKIVDSSTLKIVKPFCSTKKTSGTGTISVTVKGASDPTFYQNFMIALLGAQQAQEVKGCQIVIHEGVKAVFRGFLDLSNIQINSAKLPQNLSLSAKDKSILLDKKIRMNRVWENESRSTIISDLLGYLDDDYGTAVSLLSDALPNTKKIKRFAVTESKEQTYREVVDKILLESAGYVLWYDPEYDGFRVKAIQTDLTGITPRVIGYLVKNQLQTKSAIYEKDGVLLSFPNVVERDNTNIYTENISVSVDEDNNVTGKEIPPGHYFPSDGDVKEIYQQYRVPDRPYISHESRLQNEDLKLIYCKNVTYSLQCNPKLDLAPSLPNVKWSGDPEYYPDRARLLFINNKASSYFLSEDTIALDTKDYYTKSGEAYILVPSHTASDNPKALGWYEAKGANLSLFSITGTAVYEDYLNKVTVGRLDPEANGVPCTNPEEYKAETIQYMNGETDFSEAIAFAKWYYKSLSYGQTTSQWTELPGSSYLGEVVYVAHKMTGIMMPHVIVQITDESIDGSRVRMNRVVAISIYGWEEYVYDNGISANGNNGQTTDRANTISTGDLLVGTATCRGIAGIVGDIYINTDENSASFGNMYRCIVSGSAFSAVWKYQANIKGSDASVTGMTYEIEYGLSTSDEEFIFPVFSYGYDAEHAYGYDSDDSYGFIDYRWTSSPEGWYHGLYVWQRIKTTDADGNVTYGDPVYAKELTQSLEDSCIIDVSVEPSSYISNARVREDSDNGYQYLKMTIRDIGYKGRLVLSLSATETASFTFVYWDDVNEVWTDLTPASTLTLDFNGTTVEEFYGIKVSYSSVGNITISGTYTDSGTQLSQDIESVTIAHSTIKNIAIQMQTVDAYEDLSNYSTVTDVGSGVSVNDNLIYGDYVLTRFVKLVATATDSAQDEFNATYLFGDFTSYYTKNEATGEIELISPALSEFTVGATYYAFRLRPWMWGGTSWVSADDNDLVKMNTIQEIVSLAKTQKDEVDSSIDFHNAIYAWDAFFVNLAASVITAEYIGTKEIKIADGGSMRGGDYNANGEVDPAIVDPTGFYISSEGRIDAYNANFKRITVDQKSTIKGNLACGNIDEYGEQDVVLATVFENGGEESYSSNINSSNTLPDAFFWSEVDTFFKNRLASGADISAWAYSYGGDSGYNSTSVAFPSINVKNSSGYLAGRQVSQIVYSSNANNPVIVGVCYTGSHGSNGRSMTVKNPLDTTIQAQITIDQGYGQYTNWFSTATNYANGSYKIYNANGTVKTSVSHKSGTKQISLGPGEWVVISYGGVGDPDASMRNLKNTTCTVTITPNLTIGMNYYSSGTKFRDSNSLSSGTWDLTESEYGARNIAWPVEVDGQTVVETQLDLTRTLSDWVSGIKKLFKFSHLYNGSAPSSTKAFIRFASLTSLYVKLADGTVLGVDGTPVLASLSSLMIATNEAAFVYNGVSHSLTTSTLIQESDIQVGVSTQTKGIMTADITPVNNNIGIGLNGNPFAFAHITEIYGDVQNGSSRTIKKNITPYNRKVLDFINKTPIYYWQYKNSTDQKIHIGIIAEEADEEMAGELHDRFKLNDTVGILIKAVQELSAQNELLAKEIEELKGGKQ